MAVGNRVMDLTSLLARVARKASSAARDMAKDVEAASPSLLPMEQAELLKALHGASLSRGLGADREVV